MNSIKLKKVHIIVILVVTLFFIVLDATYLKSDPYIDLKRSSKDVKVNYTSDTPKVDAIADLATLSEYEVFHLRNTSIFRGEVKDVQNIKIEFGEGGAEYQAIAKIEIDEVYRGAEEVGDIVEVRLPCPIRINEWKVDTEVVSAMRVGTKGIFMPLKYKDSDYWEQCGSTLYVKDICDYGFMDGKRYAFLKREKGISIYDFRSFPSIKMAVTLDDIEKYVLKMINVQREVFP